MDYVRKTRVSFSQTGSGESLSALGAAQIIQDNLCAFFACFKKDNVTLSGKYNAIWVFVKNKFRMEASAKWDTEVTAKTRFVKLTSATAALETVIENCKGEVSVRAVTEACVIDLGTQRIRRISSVEMPETEVFDAETGLEFERFDVSGVKPVYDFYVPSTSIDFCKHLNNVEYLRFIFNTVSADYDIDHPVREVEIHYVSQSREGEKLTVLSSDSGDNVFGERGITYEIKNGEKTAVKCRVFRGGISE